MSEVWGERRGAAVGGEMKQWKLKRDRLGWPAGTIVTRYEGFDYGLKGDDERATGKEHMVVTAKEDGDQPFFTVAVEELEEIA